MNRTELLNIFSTFTREDWNNFDNIRNLAFQPTQSEIDKQKIQQALYRKNEINSKLANLWIARPEIITKEFIIWLLTQMKAEQFIWDDFSWWIDNQILLFWDIETAFDELLLRFL